MSTLQRDVIHCYLQTKAKCLTLSQEYKIDDISDIKAMVHMQFSFPVCSNKLFSNSQYAGPSLHSLPSS